MSGLPSLAVRAAVRMLPRGLRDRYREQWAADLRDASEAGLRPSGIALGSLAFALTVDRPTVEIAPSRMPAAVHRRERMASGLALGAAVVTLSQFGSVVTIRSTDPGPMGFLIAFVSLLLTAYLALAPVVAAIVVSVTRGVAPAVRVAVWLLVLASTAFVAQTVVDSGRETANVYATAGTAIYGVAAAMTVVAAVLLVGHFPRPEAAPSRRRFAAVATALGVGGSVWLGTANLMGLTDMQRSVQIDFVDRVNATNPEQATALAANLAAGEAAATAAIATWAVVGVLAGAALLIVGFARTSTTLAAIGRAGVVLCVLFVSHAGVYGFVQLTSIGGVGVTLPVPEVLLLLGRWGLIATALATVGGLRFERGAWRRHAKI